MSAEFFTRKIVKSEDLNTNGTLHGGRLLHWADEEAGIYCAHLMDTHLIITRSMEKTQFLAPAKFRDIVEFGFKLIKIGRTNMTVSCEVRNLYTKKIIAKIDEIICVCTNEEGKPQRHALSAYCGTEPRSGREMLALTHRQIEERKADQKESYFDTSNSLAADIKAIKKMSLSLDEKTELSLDVLAHQAQRIYG